MSIGNRVRQLRQAKNMKIADLAEAIGVDAA
ncbi:transcriptional regulator, partial [Escherichia coli]